MLILLVVLGTVAFVSHGIGSWFTLGVSNLGKLLAVAHTFMRTGPERARVPIISAREATKAECRQYENEPR